VCSNGADGAVKDEGAFAFADLTLESKAPSRSKGTGTAGQGEGATLHQCHSGVHPLLRPSLLLRVGVLSLQKDCCR